MYARLPFDDAETVRANREGILRRLGGDDKAADKAAVERWSQETDDLETARAFTLLTCSSKSRTMRVPAPPFRSVRCTDLFSAAYLG